MAYLNGARLTAEFGVVEITDAPGEKLASVSVHEGTKVGGRGRRRYAERLRRGAAAPTMIRMHQFAWRPVFIRTGRKRQRWVWLRPYTRWLIWLPALDRYRTIDTRLGWQ